MNVRKGACGQNFFRNTLRMKKNYTFAPAKKRNSNTFFINFKKLNIYEKKS